MKIMIVSFLALLFIGCQSNDKKEEAIREEAQISSKLNSKYYGNYVSDDYNLRNEGYDWVGVIVKPLNEFQAKVSVRSRIDLKKASCTFDNIAQIENDSVLVCNVDGNTILFEFTNEGLNIKPKTEQDENALYFFCSGGGTLKGFYKKLDGELDEKQIDKTVYLRYFPANSIGVEITRNDNKQLKIRIYGPDINNEEFVGDLNAGVIQAELGDLNADSFPEIYIYTLSNDGSRKGDMIAYSSNNGKSFTPIYLPPITDNSEASKGYNGGDEFAVVENTLVRRFPIIIEGKTVGTKQIQYKLTKGESAWQLVIDKIVEY